jgi:hypothetical protein
MTPVVVLDIFTPIAEPTLATSAARKDGSIISIGSASTGANDARA